jgi:hypothetical protein
MTVNIADGLNVAEASMSGLNIALNIGNVS